MINICEVGPRDGLQNEKKLISLETKVEMINRLVEAGAKKIEAVSFVNPKVVPQMANAEELMKLVPKTEGVSYAGLVLNYAGLQRALGTEVDALHIVTSTSDEFNLKNAKKTVNQSVSELITVIEEGKQSNRSINGILGTAFGCPFAGEVPLERVLQVAEQFVQAGATEITLADTTGMANPKQIKQTVERFKKYFSDDITLGLHLHNTRGLGVANAFAGYEAGIRNFDSSIAGLGGCPFAPEAVGNVCTEDLVNMFEKIGVDTSLNITLLIETSRWLEEQIGRKLDGMVMKLKNL
ncbi:hydroxymethylglutaryl-CoA lyase [Planococcus versutus]|uniref:Hydroxymethylglutaryl-CoA lyase n=1 Tax=Planococcus versutus TaxID=1302659 RepID=A0A1B1RZE9_9BACL|nr:hydroxymethylglutaryl-CoA lyase [Planococcus versutus]ANU26306.1 hydroxymethylglutaryl-CoA lyase [Planococcus versutus]